MKAVILCGGFGKRLGKLTSNCPKPLLKFNNRSIIEWQILNLKKVGVNEIFINLHYLSEQIRDYIGNGSKFSTKINYFFEKELTGTAGGVKIFEKQLKTEKYFFVLYGDILINEDLSKLIYLHEVKKADCSIYFHENKNSNSLLYLDEDNGLIKDLIERPNSIDKENFIKKNKVKKFYSNSSIYLINSYVLNLIPVNKYSDFPKDIFPKIIEKKKLYGLKIENERYAIDSIEKYNQANKYFKGLS